MQIVTSISIQILIIISVTIQQLTIPKGDEDFRVLYKKDKDWYIVPPTEMTKRYYKSKFKNTLALEQWNSKNGWERKIEIKYSKESHDIPTEGYHLETNIETKSFSITVRNDNTVKAINEIREKYGEYCIEYVLRDDAFTEIIYKDTYIEI